MAQINPPTITAAPAVPIRGTSTFKTAVDAFLTWVALAVTMFQNVATNCYLNAVDCFNNAVAAAASAVASDASATLAAASATAATAAANATLWVSGVVVNQDVCKISPADRRTYRKKTAASSTAIDPSVDVTNYVLISNGVNPRIKVSHRLATGTAAGASTATTMHTRVLNTSEYNSITGASLSSNQVVLPAGTYNYRGRAPTVAGGLNQAFLYNVTDATYTGAGSSTTSATGISGNGESTVFGQFTIAATKTFELRHYITTGVASGLGLAVSTPSQVEVYAELEFEKVA